MKNPTDVLVARGHPLISAKHPTTLMTTRDEGLSSRGDCIVGVCCNKGLRDLSPELKRAIRRGDNLKIKLKAGDWEEVVYAKGHPSLTLSHPSDIVIRKSKFICERTLAICATKAAKDFSREFIQKLRREEAKLFIQIEAFPE